MNRIRGWRFVVFVLSTLIGTGSATSQTVLPHADTQTWNDVQVAIPVNDHLDVMLLGTLRIGRDISNFVDERAGVGISYKLNKYITIAPNYQYITMQPVPNRKSFEHRFTGAVTLRLPLEKFTFSDRNQFERRIRRPQVDATRYRNRFMVEHPLDLGKLKLTIFASDEVFYDWSVNDWVRNRFAAGVNHKFNKHFTLDLYYMRQNDGRTRPGDLNVIGAIYRIRL
ncbi:MAG TPA: DUF2490 domain-containing protein [Pyrinomonadaceae bacterium]